MCVCGGVVELGLLALVFSWCARKVRSVYKKLRG